MKDQLLLSPSSVSTQSLSPFSPWLRQPHDDLRAQDLQPRKQTKLKAFWTVLLRTDPDPKSLRTITLVLTTAEPYPMRRKPIVIPETEQGFSSK
ncbi:hypothetical protein FGO68_gene10556 [Halteria grandinella]|uniref:Uncharacterized protein n=1 Tax=Halteria grandinella TaxID=5974 RepID=A0A8J8NW72_HALGN|nr:hypothetical protein FGO68_gene10556 [Halteria grandinella]